eukprot:214545-Rhodomonas_salina.1
MCIRDSLSSPLLSSLSSPLLSRPPPPSSSAGGQAAQASRLHRPHVPHPRGTLPLLYVFNQTERDSGTETCAERDGLSMQDTYASQTSIICISN